MQMNHEKPTQIWARPWPAKRKTVASQWFSHKRRDIGRSRPIERDDLPF